MNKIVLSLATVLAVISMITAGSPVVLAQEPTADIEVEVTPTVEASPAASIEAEIESPGILPTNPFYFIKKFGWSIRRVFTFNPVKKVELELRIADQRAAEIRKLSEVSEDEESIAKAAENYEDNVLRLKAKLEALKETSENPNIDVLLDKVIERSLKHQELFDELKNKHEEIRGELEKAKSKIDEVVAEVPGKEADPEKFKDRLDRALDKEAKQEIIQEIEKAEILERINGKVSDDVLREKLMRIRDDVAGEATLRVKAEIQAPTIDVNVYFRELLDKFDIESASITEDYARLLFEIARKIINYAEQNLTKVTSLTDETPAAMVARARALLAEAERAQSAGDINLAWSKLREITSALRGLRFPEIERQLPAADPNQASPRTSEPGTPAVAPDRFIAGARMQIDILRRAIEQCRFSGTPTGEPRTEPGTQAQYDVAPLNCNRVSELTPLLELAENLLSEAERAKQAGNVDQAVNKAKEVWGMANRGISLIYQDPSGYLKRPPVYPTKPLPMDTGPAVPLNTRQSGGDDGLVVRPTPVVDIDIIAEPIVPAQVRVVYNGNFDPQVVKVKKGGTVTFVNSAIRAFWPASGVHPTHEIYPEFDARQAIEAGASWSFTFEKVGTWRFHDHLNPSTVGAVEVVE